MADYDKLDRRYREAGWGLITDAALGIPPHRVESQARMVADFATELAGSLQELLDLHVAHHNNPAHAKARALLSRMEGR